MSKRVNLSEEQIRALPAGDLVHLMLALFNPKPDYRFTEEEVTHGTWTQQHEYNVARERLNELLPGGGGEL